MRDKHQADSIFANDPAGINVAELQSLAEEQYKNKEALMEFLPQP